MKKPRSRKSGTGHTISSTDEEWDVVRAGAVGAGTPVSACRMRSRVTENTLPTSWSVWSVFVPMPKRIL